MDRPNILIFMTDHQRADTVLPEHPCQTPHLDRFAAEGVTFTETYCPAPHCCPARATFMSGQYPSRTGIWNNVLNGQALQTGLNEGVRLWSEDLAAAGYRLHYNGKWHVTAEENPADRGWTEHDVACTAPQVHGPSWEGYRRVAAEGPPGARERYEIQRPGYGNYKICGVREDEFGPGEDDFTRTGTALIHELAESEEPWCLYMGQGMPHDPYVPPRRFRELYDLADVPLPPSFRDELADKPAIYQRLRRQIWGQLDEEEVREAICCFWALCTHLDEMFGELLKALEETGQAENTLVVYTSDHGDYCGDHGLFAKGIASFRGAYNVPAVVRWPRAVAEPGRRVEALVSLADFAPTFLEAAGLPVERPLAGRSLLPFLRGEEPPQWREAICTQCDGVELYYSQRAVWTREWKYVFNGFDFDELYHLSEDPHELRNLADDPAYDDVKRRMCRHLWRFAREQDDSMINQYITVGLAPYGPAEAFRD
jgi:arylsulfatase A-like enzyme